MVRGGELESTPTRADYGSDCPASCLYIPPAVLRDERTYSAVVILRRHSFGRLEEVEDLRVGEKGEGICGRQTKCPSRGGAGRGP